MERIGADGAPRVLELLDRPGCVLCRTLTDAAGTWVRWFVTENHASPDMLAALEQSIGFCPPHTRRLLTEGTAVLRLPWVATVRGAVGQAERLAARQHWGQRQRKSRQLPCPLCQVLARREHAARSDLAAGLENSTVQAAIRDHEGLCFQHLKDLLPGLAARSAAVASSAVAGLLATVPSATQQAATAVTGHDADALARVLYVDTHASMLEAERVAGQPAGVIDLAPPERMIADLQAGSCPICRAAGREEIRYLYWLGRHTPGSSPASSDLHLCRQHLHDAWSMPDAGPCATGVRTAAARSQAEALAAAAAVLARAPRRDRRRSSGEKRDGAVAPEPFRAVVQRLADDDYCRACQVKTSAAARQQALLRTCLQDPRILRVLEESHGLCLLHAAQVSDPEATPVLNRLLTQLRQLDWELEEDSRKRAWDHRHEPKGHEQSAWWRLPALLDGDVFLGLALRAPE